MARSDRLFEVIQILRAANAPMTAAALAERLEVSPRTIYRDIATLQSRHTPIEGEAGIGYMLRAGYDLPPLNFDEEELEALHVGLAMLLRTGDAGLQKAAARVSQKITDVSCAAKFLRVDPYGLPLDDVAQGCVSLATLRQAIREARKLELSYVDKDCLHSTRMVRPLALTFFVDCAILAAWCELRGGFRHFRTDRMLCATLQEVSFATEAPVLRQLWQEQEAQKPSPSSALDPGSGR